MREFVIAGRVIGPDSPPYLLAEVSHNHLGSYELCREAIRLAAEVGADGVKLQRRGPTTYAGLRKAGEIEYADMREAREFDGFQYLNLMRYARERGLAFIVTAFDFESADFLAGHVRPDAIKIASGDITNLPLLRYVARFDIPMIVSTGGADECDLGQAYSTLKDADASFTILACTSSYPCAVENANLRTIQTYQRWYDVPVGLSCHLHRSRAVWSAVAAVMLGASILEYHYTITPAIGVGEHAFAVTPKELREMVDTMGELRTALGDGRKMRLEAEAAGALRLGKHLAWAKALSACHVVKESDFAVVAPGRGVPPNQIDGMVGGTLIRDVQAGEDVEAGDVARGR